MTKINHHKTSADKIRLRVRAKTRGTSERPRLHVFRSNKHISLQVIDDSKGKTLAAASSLTEKVSGNKTEKAKALAQSLAKKLQAAKITKLVFDRGSYRYHGRVRAVAEAMRESGMNV
jgi:large subunit ribosomal protein L18